MIRAIIISGYLNELSDNFIEFLDRETDIYVHTWDIPENRRWIEKLNRYKKYANALYTIIEKPKFDKKLHSYFYSTYKAVNLIKNIDGYKCIIKFKPNLEGDIKYVGDLEYYFTKGYLQSYPLLKEYTKEDCIYGSIYYKTMDERVFSGYPLAFSKMFHILEEEFIQTMIDLDKMCMKLHGEDYEGSIFWKLWADVHEVKQIQDIDLKLPHNKANSYGH
jgi:hypothetical protein